MGDVVYMLKVLMFHGTCYLIYQAVLRKSDYFSLNRAYLLCTLSLGFIAPILLLPVAPLSVGQAIAEVNIGTGAFFEAELAATNTLTNEAIVYSPALDLLQIIYFVGVLILALRSVLGISWIMRIKSRGVKSPGASPKVITIKNGTSFSFINTILLQESTSHAVYLHEKCHVVEKHWLDLIVVELACILSWTNPVVWLYKRSLKQQHEYLADDYVLRNGISRVDYLQCIFNSLSWKEAIGPVHMFNSQSLKQRISMMTNERFLSHPKLVYSAILPVVALLLWSFSGSTGNEDSNVHTKVFVIDAAHGGNDAGAISQTGMTEKNIALDLAILVHEIGKAKGLSILLTRASDQRLSFEERISISSKANADVFISLHLGFDEKGVRNGLGMFVSDENAKHEESKRIAAVLAGQLSEIRELGSLQVNRFNATVLKKNTAASAILEVGYLSNERDVEFISDPKNQRKIAEKIVASFVQY